MSKSETFQNEPGSNQTITIAQKAAGRTVGGAARSALVFGMKPAVLALGAYAVVATAAAGFMLPWGMGLSAEVDRLEVQVNRLSNETDRLEGEVDRYELQNELLAENNEEFSRQNVIFEASNDLFEENNDRLDMSVEELREENKKLSASNVEYRALNAELQTSGEALTGELDELTDLTETLTKSVKDYEQLSDELSAEVTKLEAANEDLDTQIVDLGTEVTNLGDENDRLSKLIEDFDKIEEFLSEQAENIQDSVEQLASFLSDQIDTNSDLVLTRMATAAQQKTYSWVCGYDLTYRGFPFSNDPNAEIGSTFYPMVAVGEGNDQGYVEETVLSELCLDSTDFELYLANFIGTTSVPPVEVTTNELQSCVSRYVDLAMDWYYPGTDQADEGGVSKDDWAAANFDCENLPREKKFFRYL